MIKKIVVIGPESTGKSTLCQQLAESFKTDWVPEYARQHLTQNGVNYSYPDLLTIAKGQLSLEDLALASHANDIRQLKNADPYPIFIDTDMYVMKVWCEYVFKKCHQWILDQIVLRRYDLYLLCNIDLPWSYDPLREYPDQQPRKELYNIYKDIMINQSVPWQEISGDYENRLEIARKAVNTIL